jgi:hypothetical protein
MAAVRSDTSVKRGAFLFVFISFSFLFRFVFVETAPGGVPAAQDGGLSKPDS